MKIMESWMTIDELEGAIVKHNKKGRDGESLVKMFEYLQLFGFHFRYHHQGDYHNSMSHSPISLWLDHNLEW